MTVASAIVHPTPRARAITGLIVALLAAAALLLTAWQQERELIPKFHDEHMHLLQMRMLAHGKLWTHTHELADFFESFHIFVEPVYASIYFPGTALIYLPAIWLNLPRWVLPMLVAAGCVGMVYRIVTELIDGVAGLLAALMLISLQWFRYLSMMVMSHSVMLLLGLLMVWSWLRWRKSKELRWAMAIGGFAGWAAITRPVDAICYALPIGVAMLIELRSLSWKRRAETIGCVVACAVPFLSLQVIQNIGITGKPLLTPYRLYADLYTPQMSFGFHEFDASVRPKTKLPQRQEYYDVFTVAAAKEHRLDRIWATWRDERFPLMAKSTTPNRLMLLLAPLALVALRNRERRTERLVMLAMPVLYIAFYANFAYLLRWYSIVIAPSVIFSILLGKEAIEQLAGKWRAWVNGVVSAILVIACAATWPGIDKDVIDDGYPAPTMWFSYVEAPKVVQKPAIILFRYAKGDNVNEEPVYNIDVVNPDDAPIVRAHDLGREKNRELFDYYARRQPGRTVYLFDRGSRTIVPLGNVAALSRRLGATTRGAE